MSFNVRCSRGLRLAVLPLAAGLLGASSSGYVEMKDAPQLFYQQGVPRTDRQGRLQTGSAADSFLPRCAYEALPGSLAALAQAGFNCFKPWNGWSMPEELAEAKHTDMQLVKQLYVFPCNYRTQPDCNPQANAAHQISAVTAQIAPVAHDSAILAWYIEEEPTGCINAPFNCDERLANLRKLHDAIRDLDPLHPSFDLDLSLPSVRAYHAWSAFNSTGDIAANDNYPFLNGTENTLESSATNYLRLLQLSQQRRPVWITVQDFGQPRTTGWHWTQPTPAQLRAEVFTAIVHGATGIFYFALDNWAVREAQDIGIAALPEARYPRQRPADVVATARELQASASLWRATAGLNAELARLQAVIFAPTARLRYVVAASGHAISSTPMRTLLKQGSDGVYTMLLVNIDNVPLAVRISLPGPPLDLQSLDAGGTARALSADGSSFMDAVEGFGVRIYRFRTEPAPPGSR
jgi:hypothetical protein